jgi:hypothetical protein
MEKSHTAKQGRQPMDNLPEVVLARPQAPSVVTVPVEPGHVYALDFSLETLQCEVQDQSLRLLFDNGAILVLEGFFAAADDERLFLRLDDGTLLQGRDVAQMFLLDPQKFVCDLDGSFLAGEESLSSVLDALPPGPEPAAPSPLPSALSPAVSSGAWPAAVVFPSPAPEEALTAEQYLLSLLS